jgi:hypothetical protein
MEKRLHLLPKKIKTSSQAKKKIKLDRVFERKFYNLIIIQLVEFYIISKHIYKREIFIDKVNLFLIEKVTYY